MERERKSLFTAAPSATGGTGSLFWDRFFTCVILTQSVAMVIAGITVTVVAVNLQYALDRAEVLTFQTAERIATAALSPASKQAAQQSLEYTARALAETPVEAWYHALGNTTLAFGALSRIDTAPFTNLTSLLLSDPHLAVWVRRLLKDVHRFQALGTFAARAMSGANCELADSAADCGEGCRWDTDTCVTS